jgi:hypothetical protein
VESIKIYSDAVRFRAIKTTQLEESQGSEANDENNSSLDLRAAVGTIRRSSAAR